MSANGAAVDHGTNSTYTNHGCRCHDCRTAHTHYSRRYRSLLVWQEQRRTDALRNEIDQLRAEVKRLKGS